MPPTLLILGIMTRPSISHPGPLLRARTGEGVEGVGRGEGEEGGEGERERPISVKGEEAGEEKGSEERKGREGRGKERRGEAREIGKGRYQ